MQGLLQLPPEVVNMIITRCDTQELLQLRLVSKQVKTIVDSSTRFKDAVGNVQINLHISTLQNFLQLAPSLPFTNFCIDLTTTPHYMPRRIDLGHGRWTTFASNSPHFYTNNPHIQTFKEKFCPQIRKLRLSAMFCGTIDAELDFFRRLESLQDLEIQELVFRPYRRIPNEVPECQKKPRRLPFDGVTNVSLKRLAVNVEDNSRGYLVDWIKLCPRLETLMVPTSNLSMNDLTYILYLGAENHLEGLKRLDFNRHSLYNGTSIDIDECSDEERRFFQEFVARRNLRLENVSSWLLSSVLNDPDPPLPEECKMNFQDRIISLDGLSEVIKQNELKNVEELCFSFKQRELMPGEMEWSLELTTIRLPALKKISGLLSFEGVGDEIDGAQDFIDSLFRPDEPRSTVTELDVQYQANSVLITPEHFDASFPNLRRLTLKLDGFTRRELCVLVQAISRKEFLEELSLSTSKGIPEAAFFRSGNPDESSLFLRLKNLKKLRLDSTYGRYGYGSPQGAHERMGNRTLRLLSRINLTHLHIIGNGWNEVTSEGIRELVDGPFGQSVLWLRLTRVVDSLLDWTEHREMMERVCYRNRLGKGLTSSSSFQQFKAAEEALVRGNYPFRTREWKDPNLHWSF